MPKIIETTPPKPSRTFNIEGLGVGEMDAVFAALSHYLDDYGQHKNAIVANAKSVRDAIGASRWRPKSVRDAIGASRWRE